MSERIRICIAALFLIRNNGTGAARVCVLCSVRAFPKNKNPSSSRLRIRGTSFLPYSPSSPGFEMHEKCSRKRIESQEKKRLCVSLPSEERCANLYRLISTSNTHALSVAMRNERMTAMLIKYRPLKPEERIAAPDTMYGRTVI